VQKRKRAEELKVDRLLIGDVIVILAFNGTKLLQFALGHPHSSKTSGSGRTSGNGRTSSNRQNKQQAEPAATAAASIPNRKKK
jgi:hypothetical protein